MVGTAVNKCAGIGSRCSQIMNRAADNVVRTEKLADLRRRFRTGQACILHAHFRQTITHGVTVTAVQLEFAFLFQSRHHILRHRRPCIIPFSLDVLVFTDIHDGYICMGRNACRIRMYARQQK